MPNLSKRERQILRLIARGQTNREIGEELGLSPNTVVTHRMHLRLKLGRPRLADLVRFALRNGLGKG